MDTLEKFIEWESRNRTHVNRHLIVLQKQIDALWGYIELRKKHPVSSVEFKVGVERLHSEIKEVSDEMKEVSQSLGDDVGVFIEVLESLKEDMKREVKREGSKSG